MINLNREISEGYELAIEFVLEHSPYSMADIKSMDFEKFFRLLKRCEDKQQSKIDKQA